MCSFSSGVLENIDAELAELQRLREAATKKKERDRIGSRRCSVISFLLCHFLAEQGRIVSASVFRIFHRIQRITEIPPICLQIQQILSESYEF